jgi:hypothetical protein
VEHAGVNQVVEVDRANPGLTRRVESELGALEDGQVRLRVDRLALTANTVTYAVAGDLLGYWDFFPTGDERWGRVPAMGWADVVESAHPDVEVGGRYYGWYPLAGFVDLTVTATGDGLRDDGAHRAAHAAVYRGYLDTRHDPMYPAAEADELGDAEDRQALLRGLFLTGFLADEFFASEDYFGAEGAVVLSASSKTAIGYAQRASERPLEVVGVTGAANADFVRSLGWYDQVVTYQEIESLPVRSMVSVDMAGNSAALAAVHDRLGDQLAYSMAIGISHHEAPGAPPASGPAPQFFFAPTEVARRVEDWGRAEYQRRCTEALAAFVAGSTRWLTVERSDGADATEHVWRRVFDGEVPPSTGCVVSLHD